MGGARVDRGDTLIELLMALAIIGISMLAIVGAMTSGVAVSDRHRKQAIAGASVMSYAEAVKQAVRTSGYQATCAPDYASGFVVPSGFVKSIVVAPDSDVDTDLVMRWNGTAFADCDATTDIGLQRIILQVASTDGRASEQLVVIIRKPCRTSDAAC